MSAPTLDRPGTASAELLPVFAIRAELEAVSDRATMREFAKQVEDGIRAAADSGSFEAINATLRDWLRIALVAQGIDTYAKLGREQREARGADLVDRWLSINAQSA
jgi:hypothetical protein